MAKFFKASSRLSNYHFLADFSCTDLSFEKNPRLCKENQQENNFQSIFKFLFLDFEQKIRGNPKIRGSCVLHTKNN